MGMHFPGIRQAFSRNTTSILVSPVKLCKTDYYRTVSQEPSFAFERFEIQNLRSLKMSSRPPTHRTRRLMKERHELQKHFPQRVRWIDPASKTKVEVDVVSNNNIEYVLRVYLPDDFPNSCPTLAVVSPARIYRRNGEPIPENSEEFHTFASREGFLTICHYHPQYWHNGYWLHQIFLKGRIWLEAYEGHLETGDNLDHYLLRNSQSIDPSCPAASSFSWSFQQVERLSEEKETLEEFYPRQVEWKDDNRTVDVHIQTGNHNLYTLRVYLPPDFPNACPTLAIVSPQVLCDWRNGHRLPENSEEFHTIGKKDDKTTICHFLPRDWIGKISIAQVFNKGHVWVHAYDEFIVNRKGTFASCLNKQMQCSDQ